MVRNTRCFGRNGVVDGVREMGVGQKIKDAEGRSDERKIIHF